MFIRITDQDGDIRLVNIDKIVEIYVWNQSKSRIILDNEVFNFYSSESVTNIEQKLYRAGIINN